MLYHHSHIIKLSLSLFRSQDSECYFDDKFLKNHQKETSLQYFWPRRRRDFLFLFFNFFFEVRQTDQNKGQDRQILVSRCGNESSQVRYHNLYIQVTSFLFYRERQMQVRGESWGQEYLPFERIEILKNEGKLVKI